MGGRRPVAARVSAYTSKTLLARDTSMASVRRRDNAGVKYCCLGMTAAISYWTTLPRVLPERALPPRPHGGTMLVRMARDRTGRRRAAFAAAPRGCNHPPRCQDSLRRGLGLLSLEEHQFSLHARPALPLWASPLAPRGHGRRLARCCRISKTVGRRLISEAPEPVDQELQLVSRYVGRRQLDDSKGWLASLVARYPIHAANCLSPRFGVLR